ncbi:MAG: hypothetical protein JWQ63_3931 [Mucilaginibacter sp.]|jgi:hypothetical protein|nr:hypothetical protein [Mucilaginibacter sp.]
MLKKTTFTLLAVLFSIIGYSQTDQLIIAKTIRLPDDSVQSKQLVSSLNGFLNQSAKPNKENEFVLKEDLLATSALLDEIKGMTDGNGPDKKGFYKCYLTNVVLLDSADYFVQFSYMSMDGLTPILRTSYNMIAKKSGDKFFFCSPFKQSTTAWRVKTEGRFSFYYNAQVNFGKINDYIKKAKEFDKKLNAPYYTTHIYFCGNFPNLLSLLGIAYKADYNGISQDNLSSFEDNSYLELIGGNLTDPSVLDMHDLWHDRLHHAIPISTLNRPVDEGCAYLYGGSWGISWNTIFENFKAYMGANKDWLTAFNENKNFGTSQQYHLYVAYVIDALIVQQIEKEKGFEAVKELLSCGKRESDNANYFRAIDKIAGINKVNFNERIGKLVDDEAVKLK